MSVFIDTSAFIAILNRDDEEHTQTAKAWAKILSTEDIFVTSNYVLVETGALVQNRLGMAAMNSFQQNIVPVLQVEWVDHKIHFAAVDAMLSAKRKKLSLVDCVSFEIMRTLRISTALTLDKHFREHGYVCIPD